MDVQLFGLSFVVMMSLVKPVRALIVLCAGYLTVTASSLGERANYSDVLDYVDPLIGSQAGGNVFAGATLPYGMVKGRYGFVPGLLHNCAMSAPVWQFILFIEPHLDPCLWKE